MSADLPPDDAPRIVKPRKRGFTYRHIVTVTSDTTFVERTGLYYPTSDLPIILQIEPSSILVSQGFGPIMDMLIAALGKRADFNYRITPHFRESRNFNGNGTAHATRIYDAIVNFVGFRDSLQPTKRAGKYHYPLDPVQFCREGIDHLYPGDEARLNKLYRWAAEIRQWCQREQLEVKTAAGGLAAQLLKDPRFYPEPRRKAPRLLNDIARARLPGNYYRLYTDAHREHRAIYLDMQNAHHSMARNLGFPCVNDLHYHGRQVDDTSPRPFARGDSDLLDRPGIFRVLLEVPHIPLSRFPPPYMESGGVQDTWIYSNELPMIRELGGTVRHIYAALISHETDRGLNAYARYAIGQIQANPDYKPWLKPVLHAPYGLLAARPIPFETGYFRAKSGTPTDYPMGKHSIPAISLRSRKDIESRLANVLHRGMIEAEVRKEALWFARYLQEVDHHDVLAVYADSVFIRDTGRPVRLLPPPWRVQETCPDLVFLDPTHFVSSTLTRLPGMPRDRRGIAEHQRLLKREILVRSFLAKTNRSKGGSNATADHGTGSTRRTEHRGNPPHAGIGGAR